MMLANLAVGAIGFVESIHTPEFDVKWRVADQRVEPVESLAVGSAIIGQSPDAFRHLRHRLDAVGMRDATIRFHKAEALSQSAPTHKHQCRIEPIERKR